MRVFIFALLFSIGAICIQTNTAIEQMQEYEPELYAEDGNGTNITSTIPTSEQTSISTSTESTSTASTSTASTTQEETSTSEVTTEVTDLTSSGSTSETTMDATTKQMSTGTSTSDTPQPTTPETTKPPKEVNVAGIVVPLTLIIVAQFCVIGYMYYKLRNTRKYQQF